LRPSIYFDFAFLTKEFEEQLGVKDYAENNRKIISASESLINLLKPRTVFLSSSGAVYDSIEKNQTSSIRRICRSTSSMLSICRIFNISGEFITKSETFALANFLTTAHYQRQITLQSRNAVIRRYCNDKELIALVFAMHRDNFATDFDSGGYEIELRELAEIVKDIVGKDVTINGEQMDWKLPVNSYVSKSNKYEELINKYFAQLPKSLVGQVEDSYRGIIAKN
jgi:nucleoside-diphosphate-sugar epimerase